LPLYLNESDVEGLITAGEAVPVVEDCFRRMAAGAVENVPRRRLAFDEGSFAVMSAVDRELGYAVRRRTSARRARRPSPSRCSASTASSSPWSKRTRPGSGAREGRVASLRGTSRAEAQPPSA